MGIGHVEDCIEVLEHAYAVLVSIVIPVILV